MLSNTIILAKKPAKGGTPANEKKIMILEKAHNLFVLKNEETDEIYKGKGCFLKKDVNLF